MSVVAVKKTDKKIKIAADSISVCGWTRLEKTIKKAKLFKVNGIIAGGVGLASENLLLENFCLTHKPHQATEREVLNFFIELLNKFNAMRRSTACTAANKYGVLVVGFCFLSHYVISLTENDFLKGSSTSSIQF